MLINDPNQYQYEKSTNGQLSQTFWNVTVFSVQHSRRNIVLYHCRCNHLFSMITRSLLHNFLRKIIIITFCSLLSQISPKTCLQANIRIYRDKRVFSQHRIKVHNTKIGSFKFAILWSTSLFYPSILLVTGA